MPVKTNYLVAVTGIKDAGGASLPVRLAVSSASEPNVSKGKKSGWLKGTATASGLTVGKSYALLRFNSIASVPTSGGAAEFLAAPWGSSVNFTATADTYVYKDKVKIATNGVAYYRCVEIP